MQWWPIRRIPRLYAAASLKPVPRRGCGAAAHRGIPRLYAAASLKRLPGENLRAPEIPYSAALCRGLIEAHPWLP